MSKKTISEKILEISAEQERLKNIAGGRQLLLYLPQPHLSELQYLSAVLQEKYGIRGQEKAMAIACRLLREEIEQE
jgi:hypothetical protein